MDNFAAALAFANKTADIRPDGSFLVHGTGGKSNSVVGLSVRTPELAEFYSLHQHGGVSPTLAGYLVSPAPIFLAQRAAHVSWLGGLSNISHENEARITALVATL